MYRYTGPENFDSGFRQPEFPDGVKLLTPVEGNGAYILSFGKNYTARECTSHLDSRESISCTVTRLTGVACPILLTRLDSSP